MNRPTCEVESTTDVRAARFEVVILTDVLVTLRREGELLSSVNILCEY